MNADDRVHFQAVLNEKIFNFVQAAQRHYQTNDLVVMLDLSEEPNDLQAVRRETLATGEGLPAKVKQAFSKPAGEMKNVLGSPEQSFWLLLINEDGDATFAAVNASMLTPGGSA